METKYKVILIVILVPVFIALGNFILMVLLGALAHIFNAPKLALGFWQSLIVYIALLMIGGFFKSTK